MKRVALFLGGLLLFGHHVLAQTVTLRTTVDNYVQGVHQFATVKLYANTGSLNIGISTLTTELILTAPVILDSSKHTSVLEIGDNWLNDNVKDQSACYDAKIRAGLKSDILTHSIPGSLDDILIATMTFQINETNLASFDLDIKCISVMLFNIETGNTIGGSKYQFENQEVSTPSTVTINILKGFNFATTVQAVTIAEDKYSEEPFELAAADTDYFESTEWSEAQNDLVAIVPPKAQFTGIAIERPDGTRNGYGDSFEDERGKLKIVNGVIQYTQAKDYFNEDGFTVWYQVESTSDVTDGAKDTGSILIKVTPVNDAPVVTITKVNEQDPENLPEDQENPEVEENQPLVVEVEVTDVEGDNFDFAIDDENNKPYISLDEARVYGAWEPQDPGGAQGATNLPPGKYIFTSEALDYNQVEHPDLSQDKEIKVTVKDLGDPRERAEADQDITIKDKDRPQPPPTIEIDQDAPRTDDNLTVNYTTGVDADGDDIDIAFAWFINGNLVEGVTGPELPAEKTAKHNIVKAKITTTTNPYNDEDEAKLVVIAKESDPVEIRNTPPEAEPHKVFIRKMAGGNGTEEFNLIATDADGDVLEFTEDNAPQKGALVINGNKATYTVNNLDEEFFGEDGADVFSIKVDDGDGGIKVFQVTVTYRENPPVEIEVTTAPAAEYAEVDADGQANSITIAIKAEDSIEVLPAGVKDEDGSIKWEVLQEGNVVAWQQNPINTFDEIIPEGAIPPVGHRPGATSECTFTLGYGILNGADRPAQADFVIRVTVTDALGSEETKEWTVTIKDVDRAPSAPAAVGFDKEIVRVNEELKAQIAEEDEAIDEDGDAIIGYYYKWSCGLEEKEGDTLTGQIKGEFWTVRAFAITKPYGGEEVRSDGHAENAITVANTAPEAADINEETNEDTPLIVDLMGGDADDADELIYDITVNPEHGTVKLDGKEVTYTPNLDFNGLDNFTYSVSDGDDIVTAEVKITVNAINDAPVLDAIPSNIYIVPDQMGVPQEFPPYTISMGGGNDEKMQEIDNVVIENITGDDIFDVVPAVDWANHDVFLTFTIKANAALGSEAEIHLTVFDNGNGVAPHVNKAEKTIKVVLGATPWYPLYAITCNEHDIHQVSILDNGNVVAELIVEGDTMKPGDYYDAGIEGLPAGSQYDIELRAWTASAGVSGQLCAVAPPALAVPDYTKPGEGELKYDVNTKKFTINTPLSASYTLNITYPNGNIKVVKGVYTPNNDGLILPEIVLPMEFFVAGDYRATVFGTNPEGDGDESGPCEFTIVDDTVGILEWPAEGFVPMDAANILVAGGIENSTVNFSWPVLSAAVSYRILVTDSKGAQVASANDQRNNSWSAKLPLPQDSNSFSWWVEAKDAAGNTAKSFTWSFSLIKKTDAPLVKQVTAGDNALQLNFAAFDIADGDIISYEVQLFSVNVGDISKSVWYTFMMPDDALGLEFPIGIDNPENGTLDLGNIPAKAGDFVLLRPFVNGKQAGSFVLYSVQ